MTEKTTIDQNEQDSVTDDAETSALWDEFDRDENQAAADDTPPDEGREEQDAAGDESPPETDEGGDEPTQEKAGKPAGNDLWANATPEHRAAYEAAQEQIRKLEQAERSNRGRLSAFQRQINELRSKAQAPAEAAPRAAPNGAGDKTEAAQPEGFLGSEEWSSFQGEYPEVAGPLAKVIGSLEARLVRQDKELQAIGGERRQVALQEQATLLAEEHPDWQQVAANAEFGDWLHSQPRHIQEAAYRNANEIVDAAEAADVVGRFKAFRSGQQGNQARQNTAGNAGPGNSRLAGKRQRQLESAAASRTRGPGVTSGIPEDGDPEVLWRQFDEAERRQAGRV